MTLDMLNVMLAVSEEGMIEEMLLALLEEYYRRRYSALAASRQSTTQRDADPAGAGY